MSDAPPENAAIGFAAAAFSTAAPKLMGRHAASEGLLRGWIAHAGVDPVGGFLLVPGDGEAFVARARELGATGAVEAIAPDRLEQLARYGTLLLPDPNLPAMAIRRRFADPRSFSLVGVTHTTASHGAMDMLCDLLAAPVEPWDALICTSTAVRETLRVLLEAEAARLAERLGATRFVQPQFPVIPLGIDTAAFALPAAKRSSWRKRLGLTPQTVAVLSVGRLSWHAKAHPLPLFAALGRAARASGAPPFQLILAGWFANDGQERAFRSMHRALAPEVGLSVLDGRKPEVRQEIWAAADIFALLVDNIQETFGLAPIEAMAAGLPVVVTDWDGFRDTVRDGIDGIRVPTLLATAGSAADYARRHANAALTYDEYLACAVHLAAVDVGAAAAAFSALGADPNLRARMGAAGQARARGQFDWAVVLRQYQALFAELRARRAAAPALPVDADPRRSDPTLAFGHYATQRLLPGMILLADPAAIGSPETIAALPAALYERAGLPAATELAALHATLAGRGATSVAALLDGLPPERRKAGYRGMMWLLRAGFARVVGEDGK